MNYIGSKYSLLDFLQTSITDFTGIDEGNGCTFADGFSGTGVVGAAYRKRGYTVLSNDIQYYAFVMSRHYIGNPVLHNSALVDYLNRLPLQEGFVYNNFCLGSNSGRSYFSDENGKRCDAIRIELEHLFQAKEIDEDTYFWLLASLINSIDKYANTASVYGAFLKKIKKSASRDFYLEPLPCIKGIAGTAYNTDINQLMRGISGDILYLDPPYNTRQYCTNYHVLETIAKYDNPVLKGKTGLREYSSQRSQYCSAKTVAQAFEDVLKHADFTYIILSYNNEGLMPSDEVRRIMSKYGQYALYENQYHRFKADKETNRHIAADKTTEFLHCLKKT